ncbi:M20/M25/M40 family metallo-hydrolase [Novosphingobium sp. ERN07]|uniref:M20/M25/M40 family metallo-hydrolase n=1 Tax=Novosphingobium sp. ERN07 TaxID=2726187 RepID=UPI0014578E44|nr:M20/M25/M40 family metallo-hydrolase [Novosphingobium sp. ERN07]NLR69539.1 M20/M25/M40 family metallo-hydrolase [Novosphingobium sp. ERN07]
MRKMLLAALAASQIGTAAQAADAPLAPDVAEFRDLYRELIETNTTVKNGSCTEAAAKMGARLKAAGLPESQIVPFATPEHPKDGGLVAMIPGTSKSLKPMLLIAHIDVVEAKREDWTRDPFKLIEEDGYFYGRGTVDDKAQAAIWTDIFVRFAKQGYKPKRTIKLALTCGEETSGAFNGAEWLANNRKDLIDAAFALNEGGGGRTNGTPISKGGKLEVQTLQVGEKAYQDFTLTATNPGGHSSQPVRANAIYDLSEALLKIREFEFPVEFNDTTRAFFTKAGAARGGEVGKAMQAIVANPADSAALAVLRQDKMLNSMLHTSCVATLVDAGHAQNALPQRATANVNCRMFPGRTTEETQAMLEKVVANPALKLVPKVLGKPIAVVPPMDPAIVGPIEKLAAKHYPGVLLLPTMLTGATDAVYLKGIPTYGVPGAWLDPDGNGIHGLNERIEVQSLYKAREYLTDLVKTLAG